MVVQLHTNSIQEFLPERFERKYFLPPERIDFAYGILRHSCLLDDRYPSEQINSLYFDTSDLDQHERSTSGDFRKDKVRIRWYGQHDTENPCPAFIELKSKQGFATTKWRLGLTVPGEDLTIGKLVGGVVSRAVLLDTLAHFDYFPLEMLHPIIKIAYWRYRFSEISSGQTLCLDCRIRSTVIMPELDNGEGELELPGGVIEIKGQTLEMPQTLALSRLLETDWTRMSKYSACLDAHDEAPGAIGRFSPLGRILEQ